MLGGRGASAVGGQALKKETLFLLDFFLSCLLQGKFFQSFLYQQIVEKFNMGEYTTE